MSQSKSSRTRQTGGSDQDFISRWSSLKHQARQQPDQTDSNDADSDVDSTSTDLETRDRSAPLTDADMPDIDTLTPDSSFSEFLSPGVSEELRNLALKKLFHSEVFNIRDGLDEYDGDYTQFEKLGDVVTADMQHQIDMEARRKAQQILRADAQTADTEGLDDSDAEPLRLDGDQQSTDAADEAQAEEQSDRAYAAVTDEVSATVTPREKQRSVTGADEDNE